MVDEDRPPRAFGALARASCDLAIAQDVAALLRRALELALEVVPATAASWRLEGGGPVRTEEWRNGTWREGTQEIGDPRLEIPVIDSVGMRVATLTLARGPIADTSSFDAAFLRALAGVTAAAIESKRHDREATAARERSQFLAAASRALAESLDIDVTLRKVAELAVPSIADWCTVTAIDPEGVLRRVAVVHRDPSAQDLATAYTRKFPPPSHRGMGILGSCQDGLSRLVEAVSDADLVAAAQDEEHLRLLRGLGVTSCMIVPMTARGETVGVLSLMHATASRRFSRADLDLAEDLAGRVALAVENARLFARESRARQMAESAETRARAVLGLFDQALGRLSLDDFLRELLERIRALLAGDTATVLLLSRDRRFFEVRASSGLEEDAERRVAVPVGEGLAGAIAAGEGARVFSDLSGVRIVTPILRERVRSLIGAPIRFGGATQGILHVGTTEHRDFTEDDVRLLTLVAGRASAAIERALLFEDERRSRTAAERAAEWTARLQAVTAALAAARGSREVTRIAIDHAHAATEAAGLVVYRVDHRRGVLVAAEREPANAWRDTVPLDLDLGVTRAAREGAPHFYQTRSAPTSPGLASGESDRPFGATAALPLAVEGRIIGVLGLGFASDHQLGADERTFLVALAQQCAQAMERVRLAEDQARARERADFLAQASALLSSTLDADEVLAALTRLAVPRLGDWCAIETANGGTTRQVAVAHVDPRKVELAREIQRRYPPDPASPMGASAVIRTGQAQLFRDITDEMLVSGTRDAEHLRLARELAIRSAAVVPLTARGRAIGAITLVWAESNRQYDEEDLAFATELAHRAALAVESAALYAELRTAVQVRDDFLSIAGHELKTPLTALLVHIQSLLRQARREPESARVVPRLDKAAEAGFRLERLINELLDVSRISAGRLELQVEHVDLADLVREVTGRFSDEAGEAASDLRVTTVPSLVGLWDRLRLEQVVANLLSNAIKYGRGKPIQIDLRPVEGRAHLRITDHGIGIDPAQQRRIFERFERAVTMREYGGFGLGLWIARQIVEASGGEIDVESRPGEGATFTVSLPLQPALAEQHDARA